MEAFLENFVDRVGKLQSSGDEYFPDGIFPAFRSNPKIGYKRPDTTIFFSSIIAFTLETLAGRVDAGLKDKIMEMCQRVVVNYPDFQNKDGLKTYNFWKTKPSRHFPNGNIFHRFEHFRIPDDIDDTAFIYLTTKPSDAELRWLKEKLKLHANGTKQWIKNTFADYQRLPAYSTWFGKNMYIEFDVSVLSNMLYCIFKYKLPLDIHDQASLQYIGSVIESNRYIDFPFRCAHQYPRTPLIIYHVARFMAAFDPVELRPVKQKLIDDTRHLLLSVDSPMDKVILSTSLMRFGVETERIPVETYTEKQFQSFYFFIAGLLTAYESAFLYKISSSTLFHMYWTCEAHCWTLLAEYEMFWTEFEKS